jgi:hypothetical protein
VTQRFRAPLGVERDGDHVEADGAAAHARSGNQDACGGLKMEPLAAIDPKLGRVATRAARLHLGDHERVVGWIGGDDIDLKMAQSEVAGEHLMAESLEQGGCGILGRHARLAASVGMLVGLRHAPMVAHRPNNTRS